MPPCGVLVYFCILKRCAFSTLRHNGQSVSWILEIVHQYVSLYLCTYGGKLRNLLQTPHVSCLISRATISPRLKRSECQADNSFPSIFVL
jgi:hypothetical protein